MFEEAWSGEAKGVAHAEEFQRTAFYAILTLGLPDQPTWDARSRSIVRDFSSPRPTVGYQGSVCFSLLNGCL